MFGDPIENMAEDIAALETDNKKLRRLVHEACKLAFEHGGHKVDPHVARILSEAGLLKDGKRCP